MTYPVIDPTMFYGPRTPGYETSGLATAFGAANPVVVRSQNPYSTSTANYPRMTPEPPPPYDGMLSCNTLD